jgi:hypothetical protein
MRYQKAWTDVFWFDDVSAALAAYDAIEALLDEDCNAWDLEQLCNLFMVLHSGEAHGWLPRGAARLDERRERLRRRLEPLAERHSHPTDATWAATHLAQLRFFADPRNPEVHARLVKDLRALLRVVDRLPEYPVESLCEMIEIYLELSFEIPGLDAIADRAGDMVEKRAGAQAGARLLVKRAARKVDKHDAQEAIRLIGRAWEKLHRQESRKLYLQSMWVATQAYCDLGLFCAARAHVLIALNRSFRSLVENAEPSVSMLSFALRLVWVELAAGRLPLLLNALITADHVAGALDLPQAGREAYLEERSAIEALLVRSIVRADRSNIEAVRISPAIFHDYALYVAEQAALVLLGHPEDTFLSLTGGVTFAALQEAKLPNEVGLIDWSAAETITLRTQLIGCELRAAGLQTKETRALVLGLFAAVEGFVATGFADRLAPTIDRVDLLVDDSAEQTTLDLDVEEDDCGEPCARVRFARGTLSTYSATRSFQERAAHGVAILVGNIMQPHSAADLARMFKGDAVQNRAFGLLHLCAIDDAQPDADPTLNALLPDPASPVRVDLVGDGRFRAAPAPSTAEDEKVQKFSFEPMPSELTFNHRRTRVASVINTRLWARAGWHGTMFVEFPQSATPYLMLIFRDVDAATKIMRGLRRRIGRADPDDVVRIAILTGIDTANPTHYRVGIAAAPAEAFQDDATNLVFFATRLLVVTPATTHNLDRFLERYRATGRFRLGAAVLVPGREHPHPIPVEPIELRRLEVKAAWEVSDTDPLLAMSVLQPDDDPIVPAAVADPDSLPVMRFLGARRKRQRGDPS